MSRSFRHTPSFGITTARSEKRDKRLANRRHRRITRVALAQGDEVLPLLRELSNVWGFDKDGKLWWPGKLWFAPSMMRK
jgi:hypothetical protein